MNSRTAPVFFLIGVSLVGPISALCSPQLDKSAALEDQALLYLSQDQPDKTAAQFTKVINSIDYASARKAYESTTPPEHDEGVSLLFMLAQAYNCRGIAYGELGKKKEAMSDFNHALILNPEFSQCLTNRGVLNSKENRLDAALKDLNQAIRLNPRLADAYEARAAVYAKTGDNAKAEHDQKECLSHRNENNNYNHVNLDIQHMNIFYLNKLLAAKPSEANYYLYRARAELVLHLNEKALQDAAAAERIKSSASVHTVRAVAYEQLGQTQRALKEIRTAIKIGPPRASMFDILCRLEWVSGNKNKALEDRGTQIKLEPTNVDHYVERAQMYSAIKQYDKAIVDFTKALSLAPADAMANVFSWRGTCYLKLDKITQAMADANKTILLNPNSADGYVCRGLCYKKLGKLDLASKDLEFAARLGPEESDTIRAQGEIAASTGNFEQSVEDLQHARQIEESLQPSPFIKPKSSLSKSDFQKAIADYTQLLKVDALNKDAIFNRGILYLCVSDWQKAAEDLKHFLKISQWQGQSSTHAALLCNVAYRKLKLDGDASKMLADCKSHIRYVAQPDEFRYFIGDLTANDAIKNAHDRNAGTIIRCFVGLDLECKGEKQKATELFNWVIDNGEKNMDEYSLCLAGLQRLQNHAAH